MELKELVRSRTDLVKLIGESITLTPQRGGAEYIGVCPFHNDDTPSLCVYPDRQFYRCWVCDEGGNCFTLVMRRKNITFREALTMLARRAGLDVPDS